MSTPNTPAHFWAQVRIGEPAACWPWKGKTNNSGYGTFSLNGELRGAHEWAFRLGKCWPLAKLKHCALHDCDNRICCNPAHIFDGTKANNSTDAWSKGRNFYQKYPEMRPRGTRHANAKLSGAEVVEIRTAYARRNVQQYKLAKKYGVSQRVISLVVRGESYR